MGEACFCGWSGEIEDKVLVQLEGVGGALACPRSGRVDALAWLSPAQREALLTATRQRPATAELAAPVAA
jgi:hypothetical protein